MNITEAGIERVKRDWALTAKESLDVRQISGAIYAFGSELATLRLMKMYRHNAKATCGYSVNLQTFYFALEV